MPLQLIRATDSRTLWDTCADRFLDEVGDNPGPSGFTAHLWITHRNQRDLLLERAAARGVTGWLGPPLTDFRDLHRRFELRGKAVGLLTRRRLISRVARRVGKHAGLVDPSHTDGVVRGHMLDSLFGELLPEEVDAERLEGALARVADDAFARRRNEWIVGAYATYLAELRERGLFDMRSSWAAIAARIDDGALVGALGGARRLYLYGLYMTRSRRRLLSSLAAQADVEVQLFVLGEPENEELCELSDEVEDIPGADRRPAIVQPAPDTQREVAWIAREVKRLLAEDEVSPHQVAVVARSGYEDTGRVYNALRGAGVPCTAVIRSRLTEIGALKALLLAFRGAASGWTYRGLRAVLDNAYYETGIDLRPIDHIATQRRVAGLDAWEQRLRELAEKVRRGERSTRSAGLARGRLLQDVERFGALRRVLDPLSAPRREGEWIELTLTLLHDGLFELRRQACEPVTGRWDVVRLDQRGLVQTENLLREWATLDHPDAPLGADEWYALLHRLLEANELSITTPMHKGVQVLEAHDAALTPFRQVFVMHANDGAFPQRASAGGVLSNEERLRLRDQGLPLVHRDLALRRERALWRAVTGAGDVRITYRTADPAGTPLMPSLMVPPHDPGSELPRTRDPWEEPATAAQANRLAAYRLFEGRTEESIAPASEDLVRHAVLVAVAESHRDTGHRSLAAQHPAYRPNPWNGELRDPRVLGWLASRFNDETLWSASALEIYAKNPFVFLVKRVLRLDEVVEAEEETTPLVFGAVAHDLLERFYSLLKNDMPRSFDRRAEDAFTEAAAEVIVDREISDEWTGAPLLWRQECDAILVRVREYLAWELGHLAEKGERPFLIEHDFGDDGGVRIEGVDVRDQPAWLRLRGRIDRVDLTGTGLPAPDGPATSNVVDYKSGRTPSANDYVDGTALQAPLYMQALENEGHKVGIGFYRSLKKGSGKYTQYAGKIRRSDTKYDASLRFALSIPGRIRAGLFEPVRSLRAGRWPAYEPDRGIARSAAHLPEGSRFDV